MLPRLVYCKKAEGTLPALRLGSLLRFQLLPPAVGLRKDALRSWVPQGRTKATRLSKTFRMRRSLRQMDSFIGSATCVFERRKSETKDRFRHIKRRIAAPSTQRSLGRNFL